MPAMRPHNLRNTLVHPLARMLPLNKYQRQVYRLGERKPPVGGMKDHAPKDEVVNCVLAPFDTTQLRVNVERDFWLISLAGSCSSNLAGGFRVQLYDVLKKVRLADRGVLFSNFGGGASGAFYLREPYQFDLPDSQILLVIQNMENAQNTIQVALYGQVLRFNQ